MEGYLPHLISRCKLCGGLLAGVYKVGHDWWHIGDAKDFWNIGPHLGVPIEGLFVIIDEERHKNND